MTVPALLVLLACVATVPAAELVWPDAEARLRQARQLAREINDRALVERVASIAKQAKADFNAGRAADADKRIREIEAAVGIDPGGWTMNGLKIFHPTPEMLARRDELEAALAAAMAKDDPAAVRGVVAEMKKSLGDQAGLPDMRRRGDRDKTQPISAADAVTLFLNALKSDAAAMRDIAAGKPVANNMLRTYADVITGCCQVRPWVKELQPDRLPEMDRLVEGACLILTRLQQPAGFFPFPDLRGKNIRFGAITERLLASQPDAVKDGWVIVPDPDGGTQFDTGLCGVALLMAGVDYSRNTWTRAGLRAADWALAQRCVPNFNYNAFSVGLLAHAYSFTQDARYLGGAIEKFRVGVAPGQVENGRWIDAHNARTVYHFIILRALHDLWEVLPREHRDVRAEVSRAASAAVTAAFDEFEKAGITAIALGELLRHEDLNPRPDPRLGAMIELTTSVVQTKCALGGRTRLGVAVTDLAALARAWDQ
ncbi:MAG: hypothetical protein HZA91_16510 [Verrucomicrobia bacterium]|nr:hypothetical protein [Verrucomicrobiota bacterium]